MKYSTEFRRKRKAAGEKAAVCLLAAAILAAGCGKDSKEISSGVASAASYAEASGKEMTESAGSTLSGNDQGASSSGITYSVQNIAPQKAEESSIEETSAASDAAASIAGSGSDSSASGEGSAASLEMSGSDVSAKDGEDNKEKDSTASESADPNASVSVEESVMEEERKVTQEEVGFDPSWTYGEFSKITSGTAVLYTVTGQGSKGKTVCINAGHGTNGGSSVKTQCHPDGTPKVTGGTTGEGALTAVAVSTGMQFLDGTAEAVVNLKAALLARDRLLEEGYSVLMIRESDDVQLDNIARTLLANHYADCHIALHYDSTDYDKGAYFMSVPNVSSYRAMEPVASHYEEHNALGDCVIAGIREAGGKVFDGGSIEMDLTQTSYSTVPSIDLELGDKASDYSDETQGVLVDGLVRGLDRFFGF